MSERSRNIHGSRRTQDILICKLCTQYLRDPRQLPCGHSFCLPCLERYYRAECQRSESGRRRSPSVERRRRGLLPCPAAPVCLHVSIVPDEGVSAFPINQRIAEIKEDVVNEMAYNISRRMGRPHMTLDAETDTASVRSDETDFSDISCETTSSAPATGSSDSPDSRSPYPNLAKYAKYFEAEKDEGFGTSSKYRSGLRSERRRVAISSSFQHRRRRVHTPSPAAFDDSTRDVWSQSHQPSRCGSAPHLDSNSTTYRPTLRPRQGSSMVSSPLLRRAARPASCIVEELVDEHDYELLNHVDETSRLNETPRRSTSTEQHRHRVLPTHRENISMVDDRKSMPAHDESAMHGRQISEDVKAGNSFSKIMVGQDELTNHSKHHSDKLETGKNSSSTVPTRDGLNIHGTHWSEKANTCNINNISSSMVPMPDEGAVHPEHHSETKGTSNNAVRVCSEPNSHEKHHSDADVPSHSTTSTGAEPSRNSKTHADDIEISKPSTSVPSRPGRRVLPNVPTDCGAAETFSASSRDTRGDDVRPDATTSDVRRARKLPTVPNVASKEHGHGHKYLDVSKSSAPEKQKSLTANLSSSSRPRSASTNFSDKGKQKMSNVHSSKPANIKSSSSDSVQTKQSTSGKLHSVDQSKSSVTGNKSCSRQSFASQKSQDSSKSAADHTTTHSKSASSSKAHGAEGVESSQTTPDSRGSGSSESTHKDDSSRASREQKGRQSECSSAEKSRSSMSTPGSGNGSGSRLTYKVNAATIQPVLMNSKKKQNSPPKTETDERENSSMQETMPNESVEIQEQKTDVKASAQDSSNIKQYSPAASQVGPQNGFNESDLKNGLSGVDKDGDRNTGSSALFSSQSLQSDVNLTTEGKFETSKFHRNTSGCVSRQLSSATDDEAPAAATANDNKDAKNNKKSQQWNDFVAILQAARTKYSCSPNRLPVSQTSRPVPVLSDGIIPCWQIQRDDFAVPSSIAITDDGSAVIADVANCLVDFVDREGNIVHSVTGTKPFSVAVSSDGSIYVGDRRSRTVRVFDMYGSDVAQWDAETTSFGWIAGIAILRNGQLAIIDRERCKVGVYTAAGERVTEFGSYGTKNSQLCMADFVAVDSHDRVIVSDSGNHQLKLFDPATGKVVSAFAGRGNADGCLLWPKGLTVDGADRIIVADGGNDRVSQFADDGRFIMNLVSGAARPYHVNCGGGGRLLGVTHFALNNASQVDVFALGLVS